jgi:WD40 repeat protein/tRNA A-37 threonylcarbamoyl transferase component Bud32
MAETRSDQSSRESRIDDAIARYLEQAEHGHPPDQQEFIAKHPDLAAELQSFFADQAQFQQLAGELAPGGAQIEPEPENQTLASPTPGSATPDHLSDPRSATMAWKDRSRDLHENVVRYFGDYELLEEIARGGMGVVFKARQTSLNRIVALKMILSGQLASPEDVQRFRTEAEAAAQLDHPGIVPIFEVGQHEGQHYFAMGFVEGGSLAARVVEGPLPPRDAAKILRAVAVAVQYAHDHGVIHRDLKPGNVLLDKDGKPRVTDFGLAKLIESGSDLTGTGQILGTPSYMPPEQAAAQVSAISRLSDVYSLGAILYCLLTGRPPFQAANPLETLLQVQKQEPLPPWQLNPNIPRDLDTVALKCLDKSPARRYGSACDLAEELQRYLDGKPILARPVGIVERSWRWCRRNRIVAGLIGAVAMLLIAGTIISCYFAVQAADRANEKANLAEEKGILAETNAALAGSEREARTKAQELAARNGQIANEEKQARVATEKQLRIATAERLAAMSMFKRSTFPAVSLALAVESGRATRHDDEGLVPSSQQALLDALGAIGGRPLVGHHSAITCMAISPDSRWVVTGSSDNTARVWDLTAEENSGTLPRVLNGHRATIGSVAFSPDSRWIVTGSDDSTARIWDLTAENPSAAPRVLTGHRGLIWSVAISPDKRWIVTGSVDKTARVWDLTGENPPHSRVLTGHKAGVTSVAISPDSRWVVTASIDNTTRVWPLDVGAMAADPHILPGIGESDNAFKMAISPDGHWIVTTSMEGPARVWDLTAKNPAENFREINEHQGPITTLAVSPDGRWIVTACLDRNVHVWDLTADDPTANPRVLAGHEGEVCCVAISPDSRWIVTASDSIDKQARVWDLAAENPAAEPRILSGHQSGIRTVAISPDNRWIVTGSLDSTARVWRLEAENSAANPRLVSGHQRGITSLAISRDDRLMVTGSTDGAALVWQLAGEHPVANPRVFAGHAGVVTSVAISPDKRLIVTASRDKTARVWDLNNQDPVAGPRVLNAYKSGITGVAISPDQHWVVTGHNHGTVGVWDLSVEDPNASLRILSGHHGYLTSVAISSDNRWIASGSQDGTARIWDLGSENPAANPRILRGHQSSITSVAFGPDGRRVVTGSDDKTVRVWDLTAVNPAANPLVLSGHQAGITSVAISTDGRWIITASQDKTARVWDLTAANPSATPYVLTYVLNGHQRKVGIAAISADVRSIVTVCDDGKAWIWRWRWDDLVTLAAGVGTNFDREEWKLHIHDLPYRKTFPDLPVPGDPQCAEEFADRGRQFLSLAEFDKAAGDFMEAIRLDPSVPGYAVALGTAQYRAGAFQAAVETLANSDWLARTGPRGPHPTYLALLALAHHRLDHGELALDHLRKFLELMGNPHWSDDPSLRDLRCEVEWTILTSAYQWTLLAPETTQSSSRATLTNRGDGSILVSGENPRAVTYRVEATTNVRRITALKLEALRDESLPNGGPGRSTANGNFVLSGFEVTATDIQDANRVVKCTIRRTIADFVQAGHDVHDVVDSAANTGWAVLRPDGTTRDQAIVFEFEEPVSFPDGARLNIAMKHESPWAEHSLGRFRLSVSGNAPPQIAGVGDTSVRRNRLARWPRAASRILKGHTGLVWGVAFSPDGDSLASGSDDATIRLWDPKLGVLKRKLEGHTSQVRALTFSPDGKSLASGGFDQTVRLWDPSTGKLQGTLQDTTLVYFPAFTKDGKSLVTGSLENSPRVWNVPEQKLFRKLDGHTAPAWAVAVSSDSKLIATGGQDMSIKLRDAVDGQVVLTLTGHTHFVGSLAFSPDGKVLASAGGQDRMVKLWNTSTGEVLHTLAEHTGIVYEVAISPDGKTVASACGDGLVRLWDIDSGKLRNSLAPGGPCIAFSPDGKLLASGGGDAVVRIWEIHSHQEPL